MCKIPCSCHAAYDRDDSGCVKKPAPEYDLCFIDRAKAAADIVITPVASIGANSRFTIAYCKVLLLLTYGKAEIVIRIGRVFYSGAILMPELVS